MYDENSIITQWRRRSRGRSYGSARYGAPARPFCDGHLSSAEHASHRESGVGSRELLRADSTELLTLLTIQRCHVRLSGPCSLSDVCRQIERWT